MCNSNPEPESAHIKIAQKLNLVSLHEYLPGMALWQGPGVILLQELEKLWRKSMREAGFIEVKSPVLYRQDLFAQSGHLEKFHEDMFIWSQDENEWALKPMNCPAHLLIYQDRARSYKEMPLRFCELGHCHRNEKSGSLQGLLRVRSFVQDDGHILCEPSQVQNEIKACLEIARSIYQVFGLEFQAEIGLRPKDHYGDSALWDEAESHLRKSLEDMGIAFHEVAEGGAFYGPKIDLHIKDAKGRLWQLGSVQLDYVLPAHFDLKYRDRQNQLARPVMIHRAAFGSLERFVGILLDHFQGHFPVWLAPVQLAILPVGENHHAYARDLELRAHEYKIRAHVFYDGSLGSRIRQSKEAKIPIHFVIGDKELNLEQVSPSYSKESEYANSALEKISQLIHEKSLLIE